MPTDKPILTVTFPLLGSETENVGDFSIEGDYLTSTDAFSVNLVSQNRADLFYLELQPVELALSGHYVLHATQLVGRVDKSISGEGQAVCLKGRDFVADMTKNRIDPAFKVTKDTDLGTAISEAAAPCGINRVEAAGDLTARNLRTGKTPGGGGAGKDFRSVKLEDLKPKPGQGVYDFCNRMAMRNGATIQPGGERGVLSLEAPDYEQSPLYQLRRTTAQPNGPANNISAAKAERDFQSLPTYALLEGHTSGAASGSRPASIQDVVANAAKYGPEFARIVTAACVSGRIKTGAAGPTDGKLYRLFYERDDDCKNQAQADALGARALSELLRNCLVYTVTLHGFEDPESHAFWGINTIVDVSDEINNVYEPMWIMSRKFTKGRQGPVTELVCWRVGAFIVGE